MRTEENIAAVSSSFYDDHQIYLSSFAAIVPLNNVENCAKGFRCEAFQNAGGIRTTYRNAEFLALGMLVKDLLFLAKKVVSDEANFWLNGYINKQNCGFYSKDQKFCESDQYIQKN